MSAPAHLARARSMLGTLEVPGPGANPKVIEMYASVGHAWVTDDEVAWCAAFVGWCLEKSGVRSTKSLAARSYLAFGEEVPLSKARAGDIAVFSRGKQPWQGHVAFYLRHDATTVTVLGGNQGNAVSVARQPRSRLLAIRRVPAATSKGG